MGAEGRVYLSLHTFLLVEICGLLIPVYGSPVSQQQCDGNMLAFREEFEQHRSQVNQKLDTALEMLRGITTGNEDNILEMVGGNI